MNAGDATLTLINDSVIAGTGADPPPAIPNAPTTPTVVYPIQVMSTVNATGQTVTLPKPLTVHVL
jgi:hypothetical protein